MKKLSFLLISVLIILLVFCSCSGGKLPEGITEEAATEKAKEEITFIVGQDYDGAASLFNEKMKSALDAAALEGAIGNVIGASGAFLEFGEASVTGKDGYAVVVIPANFENGTLTFTISVDAESKIGGLYFK